jgi:hypothetical protein
MSRYIRKDEHHAIIDRFRDTARQTLADHWAACNAPRVYAECRAAALRTAAFRGHNANLKAYTAAVATLVAVHGHIRGDGHPPTAAEVVSPYGQMHLAAYLYRLEEAIWGRMHDRLDATPQGRLCLDHIWRMIDAGGLVLEATVPEKVNRLLASAGTPSRPRIDYRRVQSLGIDIAA